jgi:uroporphyrin-III C-methyltransferase / precorrin-2 dehydrogenase / sirohydrochlorin ferrochelatase
MSGYPIELDLAGRTAVVVGGGPVALRRTKSLVDAGATVTVIAPVLVAAFTSLHVTILTRRYRDGDLDGAWLVHAVTDDSQVNAAVADAAERARIWCVRADDAKASPARVPAVTRHGDITVAVTSDGDPRRSQRLRSAISHKLAAGELPVRRQRPRRPGQGHVALVGGGPGDPGLMTVLGRRLLAQADVVVADRLGPREILAELDPDVEIIEAGKAPGAHRLTQDQINEVIVERALAGNRVVRLKGGDPFVFGRGGEEALACVKAGVPVQVIPGITSAIAVPAYAGIPVTHRGITQDFAVVSAHLDPSQPGASVDWAALAAGPGTLVLLMAMAHLEQITAELIKRGRDGTTPVAVIQDGTTEHQQVLISTLERVAAEAAAHRITSPAVVVIGDVVSLRAQLAVEYAGSVDRNRQDRQAGAAA